MIKGVAAFNAEPIKTFKRLCAHHLNRSTFDPFNHADQKAFVRGIVQIDHVFVIAAVNKEAGHLTMKTEGHVMAIVTGNAAAPRSRFPPKDAVEFLTIEAYRGRHILSIFFTAFDLQRVNIGFDEFVEVFTGIEILHAEEKSVTRFIEDFIGLTAGIGAFPAIAAAGILCAAEKAKATVAIAKATVAEGLDFDIFAFDGCLYFAKFLCGQFAGHDHSFKSEIYRRPYACEIMHGQLG